MRRRSGNFSPGRDENGKPTTTLTGPVKAPQTASFEWEGFWTTYEAAEYLAMSSSRLWQLVAEGRGPQAYRIADRLIRFKPADVREWAESRKIPRKEG